MPIRGLTDRHASFPEIGRIRKGAPKEPDRPGKDLSYFRVEFDEAEFIASSEFTGRYGPQPRELDILLPFDTVEENFEAWREAYLAGGMIHRCDGENVVYAFNPETGETLVKNGKDRDGNAVLCDGSSPVAFYEDSKGHRQPVYCQPRGRLKVILPILRRMAFLTVLTGSMYDIANLSSQLEGYRQIVGKLAGIPLVLRRRPREISRTKPDGHKVRMTKYLLSVEADPAWVERKIKSMRAATTPMVDPAQVLELPAPAEKAEILEGEEEPEGNGGNGENGDAPKKFENGISTDPATQYWITVYSKAGLDERAGRDILKQCEGDYVKARKVVEEQHIPPASR